LPTRPRCPRSTLYGLLLVLSTCPRLRSSCSFFFLNDPATTETSTLSLHDALPIYTGIHMTLPRGPDDCGLITQFHCGRLFARLRSEEHTSELQSLTNLVCRLLLEKKKLTM